MNDVTVLELEIGLLAIENSAIVDDGLLPDSLTGIPPDDDFF